MRLLALATLITAAGVGILIASRRPSLSWGEILPKPLPLPQFEFGHRVQSAAWH